MSIIVKGGEGGNYTPHPEGAFPAVCCDVQDLGWEEHPQYGWKYKIRLVFFCGQHTEEKEVEGVKKRFPMTVSKKFTASLSEKSNLRAFVRSWRGKDLDAETLKTGLDFEKMLGVEAYIQVSHFEYQNSTYAGIDSIMRLPKEMAGVLYPNDYKRLCDREDWKGPNPHPAMSQPDKSEKPFAGGSGADDDLPFAPVCSFI